MGAIGRMGMPKKEREKRQIKRGIEGGEFRKELDPQLIARGFYTYFLGFHESLIDIYRNYEPTAIKAFFKTILLDPLRASLIP